MKTMKMKIVLISSLISAGLLSSAALAQTSPNPARPDASLDPSVQINKQREIAQAELAAGNALISKLPNAVQAELKTRQQQAEQMLSASVSRVSALSGEALRQAITPNLRVDEESALKPPVRRALPPSSANSTLSRLAPEPADLLPSLDAPITPEMIALANQLGSPVAIFEYVRKNIAFVPSYGSLQGAAGALATKRANAVDTASLLASLLRARGVHSRYVRGQVTLEMKKLQRWLGVDSTKAVTDLLSAGGIAFEPVLVGGQVGALKFEHCWIEAWVDFVPSRGAKHVNTSTNNAEVGDAWVALDASFKDLDYQPGVDFQVLAGIDAVASASAINAASTINSAQNFLNTIGAAAAGSQMQAATARLTAAFGAQNLSNARLRDLFPHATDKTPAYPFFLGSLAYQVANFEAPVAALPASTRMTMQLQLQLIDNGQVGASIFSYDQPTVALYGKRLQLEFTAAADADKAVLTALIPNNINSFTQLPEAIPAYLVQMKANLRLDNAVVAQSNALGMGRMLQATQTLTRPDGVIVRQTWSAAVGESRTLGLDIHGGLDAQLRSLGQALNTAATNATSNDPALAQAAAKTIGSDLLALNGVAHFAASSTYQSWLAGPNRVVFHRAPSNSTSALELEVSAPLGMITAVYPTGFGVSDVSPDHIASSLERGNLSRFAKESLVAEAAFGHLLLEQLFAPSLSSQLGQGDGRSAGRVFTQSMAVGGTVSGQTTGRLYSLAPEQTAQLSALALPALLNDPLASALARGDRITFNSSVLTLAGAGGNASNAWKGYGATIDYPQGLGGTSFVVGNTRATTAARRTGASVSSPVARGLALTAWLGSEVPSPVLRLWPSELQRAIAASDSLVSLAKDPLDLAPTPLLTQIIAGTVLHQSLSGLVDPLIEQHLWLALLAPSLSISPVLDTEPPALILSALPSPIDLGQTSTIRAVATDNVGVTSLVVSANGTPITLSNGQNVYTPTRAGVVPVKAIARDAAGNVTQREADILVRNPGDNTEPVVHITSPADDALVTKPTDIKGDVFDESLKKWVLAMRPGNSPDVEPVILAEGTQNVSLGTVLAKLDPTMMFNGVYVLILQAEDVNGLVGYESIQVRIDGDMKLGHFSVTFLEAEVPLAGIPIRVTRTYDTRQAKDNLIFGYGWSIDYQNVRLRESRKLGFNWRMQQNGGGFSPFCVRSGNPPIVTITLPDGETEQFKAKWNPECQQWLPPIYGELVFEPANSETHGKLEQLDYGTLRVTNLAGGASNIVDPGELEPVDPNLYKYTSEDGMEYLIDQKFGGVRKITDKAGNSVTYTDNGIVHSSGTRVDFIKDAQKRITAIVLPDGRRLNYQYDAKGDLISAADAANLATTYGYLPNIRYPHYLEKIIDARGIQVARHEYDDDGRLIKSFDADGNPIVYTHNIVGKTEIIKNRRGFSTSYTYDDNGWILLEKNALGEERTWTYDQNGSVLSQTDGLGRKTEFTVDPRGNALTEKDPTGAVTTRTWGYYNQLKTETDALGRVTNNKYFVDPTTGDELNYATQSTNPAGERISAAYDLCGASTACSNTGNPRSLTDPTGASTLFSYNRQGLLTRSTNSLGQVTQYEYDAMGRNTKIIEERTGANGASEQLITTNVYDAKGQLIKVLLPDGATLENEYNATGKLTKQVDELGRTIRMEYDRRGALTKKTFADNTFEAYEYNEDGLLIAETDRMGRTTRKVYDAADRVVQVIYPDQTVPTTDNPKRVYQYDAAGQLLKEIDESGSTIEYKYDAAGRNIEVIDSFGSSSKFTFDAVGQRLTSTDAFGNVTKYEYDGARRLVKIIFPDNTAPDTDNPVRTFTYDGQSNRTSETDELGRVTRYAYNSLRQLVRVVKPNPATGSNPELVNGESPPNSGTLVTKYSYDTLGNIVSVIDGNGNETKMSYDRLSRLTSKILPMGQQMTMSYFPDGKLKSLTNYRGQQTTYEYDSINGWLNKINHGDGRTSTFTYQANGQRLSEKLARADQVISAMDYRYDERGQMIASRQFGVPLIPGTQDSTQYTYDLSGNLTQQKTAAQTINYIYEPQGGYSIEEGGRTTRYTFDKLGNATKVEMSDGSVVTMSYDVRNHLKTMVQKSATDQVLLSQVYTLNALGLRTAIQENYGAAPSAVQRSYTYQYDHVARLISATVSGAQPYSESFTYDKASNRTQYYRNNFGTIYATYDANNRLIAETGNRSRSYEYDDDGNLTQVKQGASVLSANSWDSSNQLVEVLKAGNTTRYRYGVDGIRAGRQTRVGTPNSVDQLDHIDRTRKYAQVMERYNVTADATTLSSRRLHGPTRPLEEVRCGAGSTTNCANPQRTVFHTDAQGSVRLLTNASGAILGRAAYHAFGTADDALSSGDGSAYGFVGEEYDTDASAYYLRARYMDPSMGRMLSTDPLPGRPIDPLSMHPYTYAHLDPINNSDPTGQFTLGEIGSALNTIGNLYNTAMPIIQLISPETAEAIESEIPSLFDYLLPMVISAAGTQVGADAVGGDSGAGDGDAKRSALFPVPRVERHHTIPVYLCGRNEGQELVRMGKSLHILIHRNMSLFSVGVELGGKILAASFKRSGRSSISRRLIVVGARTDKGRAAIAGAIGSIYVGMGLMDYQYEPIDKPLGIVFGEEAIGFMKHRRTHTSYPACSRSLL